MYNEGLSFRASERTFVICREAGEGSQSVRGVGCRAAKARTRAVICRAAGESVRSGWSDETVSQAADDPQRGERPLRPWATEREVAAKPRSRHRGEPGRALRGVSTIQRANWGGREVRVLLNWATWTSADRVEASRGRAFADWAGTAWCGANLRAPRTQPVVSTFRSRHIEQTPRCRRGQRCR